MNPIRLILFPIPKQVNPAFSAALRPGVLLSLVTHHILRPGFAHKAKIVRMAKGPRHFPRQSMAETRAVNRFRRNQGQERLSGSDQPL